MKQVDSTRHQWQLKSLLRFICIIALFSGVIFGLAVPAHATNHFVRFNEIMAGANGDSNVQFIEMEISSGQHMWGPQGNETIGRAQLLFFDTRSRQTGRFVFSEDPPAAVPGSNSRIVLIATQAFADLPGTPTPDIIMPPEIRALHGKICFDDNMDENPNGFQVTGRICLSYGGPTYFGATEGAGPAVPGDLPIVNTISVQRTTNFNVFGGPNNNADFQLSVNPNPTNSAGDTFTMEALTIEEQGSKLYFDETFEGNGRTCGSCHFEDDELSISPDRVADMLINDPMNPLFIANFNLNILTLDTSSTPSDLRGHITDTNGMSVFLLNGTEDTYLVYGGLDLSGAVTDEHGNSGTVSSVTEGNLDELENHDLMTGGRLLFLGNPDGFVNPAVFHGSLHNLNLNSTAPFGHQNGKSDLRMFVACEIAQHNPLTMARVAISNGGSDFRNANAQELAMMETFLLSVRLPKDQIFNLDNVATTLAQKRGRELYTNDAKCSACHGGDSLALNDGTIVGRAVGLNDHFDTGVTDLPINDDLLGNADIQDGQAFNTPSLWGIRFTDPYFHDNAIDTLRDAILFYDSPEFRNSPAFDEVGSLETVAIPQNRDDLLAFLKALVDLPVDYTRTLVFSDRIVNSGPSAAQSVDITNIVTDINAAVLTIDSVNILNVSDRSPASAYAIVGNPVGQTINGGNNITIDVTFSPDVLGTIEASLEIVLIDNDGIDYAIGIELIGNGLPPNSIGTGYEISAIVPSQGYNDAITSATLFGKGFLDSPRVALFNVESGIIELINVGYINDTQITFNIPADLQAGLYSIRTMNPDPDHRSAVLLDAYEVRQVAPIIDRIVPALGLADRDNLVSIHGSGFDEGALVKIDGYLFTTQQINSELLNVNIPAGLLMGIYDVKVLNQNGKMFNSPDGYRVLSDRMDDLWATDNVDLWTGTRKVRYGEKTEIGLVVHRIGGTRALIDLPVDFYEDDQNGTFIGRGTVNLPIRGGSQSTTAVLWTPTVTGTQTLYAVIDPDNDHPDEIYKDNNHIIRNVVVWPPPKGGEDVLAPRVGYFRINEGQDITEFQDVSLTVRASDENDGTNSGVHQIFFAEYNFNQNTSDWVRQQVSGWLDGSPTLDITLTRTYSWTLLPTPGQMIIHAWAIDGAGNISYFANEQTITFWEPNSSETISANESRFYAIDLEVGDRLNVTLTPIRVGDPDLFIWPSHNLSDIPPYVSNRDNEAIDEIDFTVPDGEAGTYIIEVYGHTYANYELDIDRELAAFQSLQAASSLSRRLRPLSRGYMNTLTFVNPEKPDRQAVGVPEAFLAGPDDIWSPPPPPPPPPPEQNFLYLPTIVK